MKNPLGSISVRFPCGFILCSRYFKFLFDDNVFERSVLDDALTKRYFWRRLLWMFPKKTVQNETKFINLWKVSTDKFPNRSSQEPALLIISWKKHQWRLSQVLRHQIFQIYVQMFPSFELLKILSCHKLFSFYDGDWLFSILSMNYY